MPNRTTYRRILDEQEHTLVAQGSHEAYLRFLKRYKKISESLAWELLDIKYKGCGAGITELITVCSDHFPYVVKKFNPEMCSFYTFWRKSVELQITDYVTNNYYSDKSKTTTSFVSFDEDYNDNVFILSESDEDYHRIRSINEIKRVILNHKELFEHQEFMMLLLTLDGYSLKDFEHTGITSQSTLYLTFNKAILKLMRLFQSDKKR